MASMQPITPPWGPEYRRRALRIHSFEATLQSPTFLNAPAPVVNSPVITLQTNAAANAYREIAEKPSSSSYPNQNPWGLSHRVGIFCRVNQALNPTATQYAGLLIGSNTLGAPYTVNSPNNVLHLRGRPVDGVWELGIYPNNAVATITTLAGVNPQVVNGVGNRLELIYNPGFVQALIDGVVGATVVLAMPSETSVWWAGAFVASGTNAAGSVSADFETLSVECFGRL